MLSSTSLVSRRYSYSEDVHVKFKNETKKLCFPKTSEKYPSAKNLQPSARVVIDSLLFKGIHRHCSCYDR